MAKTVTLSCQGDDSVAYNLRINYDSGLVEQLGDNGSAYTGTATANISDTTIVWSTDYPSSYLTGDEVRHDTTAHWEGRIDRLSGTGWFQRYLEDLYHNNPVSISCHEASEPKF
ncbi:MAG: hypothetical protein K8R18_17560 [Parvibaculum sp.]|uniref:hypothetical protein n=1 Tax=Parvibaculum sp. TaxID=2024848 RepID=UPI0025FDCB98|nr:hypothetical protein [Parvibaculum sp.]MCE9651430.1 hypothetical protein [Parvibaculum sp.]